MLCEYTSGAKLCFPRLFAGPETNRTCVFSKNALGNKCLCTHFVCRKMYTPQLFWLEHWSTRDIHATMAINQGQSYHLSSRGSTWLCPYNIPLLSSAPRAAAHFQAIPSDTKRYQAIPSDTAIVFPRFHP